MTYPQLELSLTQLSPSLSIFPSFLTFNFDLILESFLAFVGGPLVFISQYMIPIFQNVVPIFKPSALGFWLYQFCLNFVRHTYLSFLLNKWDTNSVCIIFSKRSSNFSKYDFRIEKLESYIKSRWRKVLCQQVAPIWFFFLSKLRRLQVVEIPS